MSKEIKEIKEIKEKIKVKEKVKESDVTKVVYQFGEGENALILSISETHRDIYSGDYNPMPYTVTSFEIKLSSNGIPLYSKCSDGINTLVKSLYDDKSKEARAVKVFLKNVDEENENVGEEVPLIKKLKEEINKNIEQNALEAPGNTKPNVLEMPGNTRKRCSKKALNRFLNAARDCPLLRLRFLDRRGK